MKTSGYLLFVFGFTLSISLCQGVSFAYEEEEEKSTVYSLQQEGWEIVKSKTREESIGLSGTNGRSVITLLSLNLGPN